VAGYGSDTGAGSFTDWIAENGYTTGSDDDLTVAQLRQRGSDYIDALYGQRFRGEPAGGMDQERAWPRVNATFWKAPVPADAIPRNVVLASYHAALHEAQNPGSLAVAATAVGAVKREKIDVLETEYFQGSGDVAADATVRLSAVEGLLAPFLVPEGQGSGLGLWAVG
jgi:hypothetical protein